MNTTNISIVTSKPPLPPTPKATVSRKRPTPTTKDKNKRKSRRIYDFSEEFLSQLFHMPQKQAAQHLGVAVITIKRCCKRHNFRWPYRANKQKTRKKYMLTEKGLAFKNLPIDCLKVNPDDDIEQEDVSSECDTDTESIDDDEQTKKDFCQSIFMLRKTPLTPEILCVSTIKV
ncbi:Hypothetical protein PHPALM_11780 [Phytophthora palmivora]|uniref:RWP-RK domain-containing protein n=1 Tax=Phytophthora palmivora TaxID=4796 RepID=A0A2P4Y1E4_9STRA|nr:Hypothetical protein PHPALM_11780 [Phytophthora palmivora]